MAGREIQTFVAFDLESTGLQSKSRITEICLLAYGRNELLIKTNHKYPRVCNKLVLCFDPLKPINSKSADISGLFNDALEGLPTFKKQASLIVSFLRNLPSPVCLIAHNGHKFDFPLLKAQLRKSNQENVIDHILCADSLWAFRNLDGLPAVPEKYQHEVPGHLKLTMPKNGEFSTPMKRASNDDGPPNPLKRGTSLISHPESSVKKRLFEIEVKSSSPSQHSHVNDAPSQHSHVNDAPSQHSHVNDAPSQHSHVNDAPPQHPPQNDASFAVRYVSHTPSHKLDEKSEILQQKEQSQIKDLPSSYSLPQLYHHYFHQSPHMAHAAEGDCFTLLAILRLQLPDFMIWCDENAVPFEIIKPMY